MICPYCFEDGSSVTLTAASTEFIYRNRKCKNCKKSWVTVEMDLDLAGEDCRDGDGAENNSQPLNWLLNLSKRQRRKAKTGK